jgi:hypothetical protein
LLKNRDGRVEQTKKSILTMGISEETPLSIDLEISNKRQDCKICVVYVEGYLWEWGG